MGIEKKRHLASGEVSGVERSILLRLESAGDVLSEEVVGLDGFEKP